MKTKYLFLGAAFILAGCSQGTDSTESIAEKIDKAIPRSEQNPCDFLSETEVRNLAGVHDTVSFTRNDSFGVCSLSWEIESEKPTDEEIIAAAMQTVKSGKVSGMKEFQRGYYSVGLNFSPLKLNGKQDAKNAFDTAKRTLTEGMTVSKETIKEKAKDMGINNSALDTYATDVTIQDSTLTDISGVGDEAFWSSQSRQLTVLSGGGLFFLTVKGQKDPESSLNLAKKIAEQIIDKL